MNEGNNSKQRDERLSIVIGTKGRPKPLRACLESIVHQTRQPDEMIIVDDGDEGRPGRWGRELETKGVAVIYIRKSPPGLTGSRNLGARQATGDVVLFLDDDVLLAPQYIEELMAVYEGEGGDEVYGVGGRLEGHPYKPGVITLLRLFGLDARARDGQLLPNGFGVLVRDIHEPVDVEWLSGCNMSFRRTVFNELLFDEAYGGNGWGDDRDFSVQVARRYRVIATPQARLVHLEAPEGRAESREFGWMEVSHAWRFFRRHMPRQPSNYASFGWAMAGILVKNTLRGSPAQVVGNLQGLAGIASDLVFSDERTTPVS